MVGHLVSNQYFIPFTEKGSCLTGVGKYDILRKKHMNHLSSTLWAANSDGDMTAVATGVR